MHQNENLSDLQLIELIKAGDNNALGELFKRYRTALIMNARTMLNSKEEAEDIVNDLFLYLQSRGKDLNITISVKAYLHKAVEYRCLKKQKLTQREKEFLTEYQTQITSHEPAIDRIESAEQRQQVHQAVGTLPDQMKKAVKLRHFEEKERKDEASEMNIELSTLAKYLLIARKRLADSAQLKRVYP
jgi:RNA polymerase sigma-70 factor (ECF subfamily)